MDIQTIYERQCSRVYRIATLYLKNTSDAEDAVQNIFLKYMEKKPSFCDENHEKAWFITVTGNYCKDILRTFWRRKVDFVELPEQAEQQDDSVDLIQYILKLQPKYREVLYLYYYEGYSVREVARILKRAESTVQTQLAAARKRLRTLLEEEGGYFDGREKIARRV